MLAFLATDDIITNSLVKALQNQCHLGEFYTLSWKIDLGKSTFAFKQVFHRLYKRFKIIFCNLPSEVIKNFLTLEFAICSRLFPSQGLNIIKLSICLSAIAQLFPALKRTILKINIGEPQKVRLVIDVTNRTAGTSQETKCFK